MVNDFILVRPDSFISVEGKGLKFSFNCDPAIHAIQWHNGEGMVEIEDPTQNVFFKTDGYDKYVAPFVRAWETEKKRVEAAEDEAIRKEAAIYNSREAREARVRHARKKLLADTDFAVLSDYSGLTEAEMEEVKAYRQALRDITKRGGYPWDGDTVPWPKKPACLGD